MAQETFLNKLGDRIYKVIKLIVGILMGILSYIGMTEFFPSDSALRFLSIFIFAPAFFFFIILVHEMGHAIAAWILKHRIHFIAVGLLGFNPEQRKFSQVEEYANNEIAGFVQYTPTLPITGRFGTIFVSFCGPLATIGFGLLLLFLHERFGYRTEYFPLTRFTPSGALDGAGRVIFDVRDEVSSRSVPHIGFLLLAIVCFFDGFFNLLPVKVGNSHKSDGRHIVDSFSKQQWSITNWCHARVSAAHSYNQIEVSDMEWHNIRQECVSICEKERDATPYLKYFAWVKSDPEAFIAISEHLSNNISKAGENTRRRYIACRILIGKYSSDLVELLPAATETDDVLHWFAKALIKYGAGEQMEALKAVKTARQAYLSQDGFVPDEEEIIFVAIENNEPLPSIKWPPLSI